MRQAQSCHKIKGGALAIIVAVLIMVCALALADIAYPFNTVTNAKVNMRRSASSKALVLTRIEDGDDIVVLGESGNYYKVQYKNHTGYVMKQYVVTDPAAVVTPVPTMEPTAPSYPYETTANASVNLREKQSIHSKKLLSIPKGATVTVHKISGTFAKVTYNGTDGYCKSEYLTLKKIVKPTATPTPVVTLPPDANASGYQVLQKGASGSHVTALQEALIELGFLTGRADGQFGSSTETAVVAFQQKNEYPDTGIVDANLQAFLYSGKPKNASGKKTEIRTLAPVAGVAIRLNDQGELVRTVQTRLRELGYYTGEITGVYDKATRTAATAFQKKHGVKADGVCGVETQQLLLGASALPSGATATPVPTATPTPAPTFALPGDSVGRGDKGSDAKLVQQRLIDLGYLTGKADGQFGSDSVAALKAFQRKNNLEADGTAGRDTYAILFSHSALGADAIATPAPTSVPTLGLPQATPTMPPLTEDNVVLVKQGVSGEAVTRLQQRLTALGYYNATADGLCKADDVAAIKSFQKKNGLNADGVAGYDTQSKMYSASAITYTGAIAGGTVDAFVTLRKGMRGSEVEALQKRLIELGYLFGTADGNFGTVTAEAVYAFQKANGLIRDGVAGSATLSLLYSATAARPTPTPAPTATPTASTLLRKGDASAAVRDMQARLIEMGYLSGKADGQFGVQTYRALMAFQRANNLLADGIAGRDTLNKLTNSGAVHAPGAATPAPTRNPAYDNGSNFVISASAVRYANWYSEIRAHARKYPYATVYDFATGLSWQVHMFSLGAHADSEPLTPADTAKLEQAFGGNTWTPKPVWVIFGDGRIYMASTHSMPHDPYHIRDNNFNGHFCIHFPRTAAQVAAIGPYATKHQKSVDDGWAITQSMIK